MIITIFLFILFLGYSLLIFFYWQSWKSIPGFIGGEERCSTFVSVIIPARNEEENIGQLLSALAKQTYPSDNFEVIVIDDNSTDNTAEIVRGFPNIKLLYLGSDAINSYKKKAIELGVNAAAGELIITTDADCVPPADWLQTIVSYKMESGAAFIVAPVSFVSHHSILSSFQEMDFMILQGITGASVFKRLHSMCNGANLAYEKKTFYEVNGFAGIDNIASGDDMLLMHKIAKKYPDRIKYLKSAEAIVATQPMPDWPSFFNQRIRWASKALYYDDRSLFPVLLLVYLFNLSFLLLLIAGFWNSYYWFVFLAAWLLKTIIELPFFYELCAFFGKKWTAFSFFLLQPVHIFYTTISGLFGQFGKYRWKGRKVR
nr:hypothetical protein [uncultured bacterium]